MHDAEVDATLAFYQRHVSGGPLSRLVLHPIDLEVPSRSAALVELARDGTLDQYLVVVSGSVETLGELRGRVANLAVRETDGPATSSASLIALCLAAWHRIEELYDQWQHRLPIAPDLTALDEYRLHLDVPGQVFDLASAFIAHQLDRQPPAEAAAMAAGDVLRGEVEALQNRRPIPNVAWSDGLVYAAARGTWLSTRLKPSAIDLGLWPSEGTGPLRFAGLLQYPAVIRNANLTVGRWYARAHGELGWRDEGIRQRAVLDRAVACIRRGDAEGADLALRSLAEPGTVLRPARGLDPRLGPRFVALTWWLDLLLPGVAYRPPPGSAPGWDDDAARVVVEAILWLLPGRDSSEATRFADAATSSGLWYHSLVDEVATAAHRGLLSDDARRWWFGYSAHASQRAGPSERARRMVAAAELLGPALATSSLRDLADPRDPANTIARHVPALRVVWKAQDRLGDHVGARDTLARATALARGEQRTTLAIDAAEALLLGGAAVEARTLVLDVLRPLRDGQRSERRALATLFGALRRGGTTVGDFLDTPEGGWLSPGRRTTLRTLEAEADERQRRAPAPPT